MVRISHANDFLETKQKEAEYFGINAKREALKYTALVYMNKFRIITMCL